MQPVFCLFFAFMLKSPHNNKTIDHVIIFICVKEKIMFAHFLFWICSLRCCVQAICMCVPRKKDCHKHQCEKDMGVVLYVVRLHYAFEFRALFFVQSCCRQFSGKVRRIKVLEGKNPNIFAKSHHFVEYPGFVGRWTPRESARSSWKSIRARLADFVLGWSLAIQEKTLHDAQQPNEPQVKRSQQKKERKER